jgi:hypothetical protein
MAAIELSSNVQLPGIKQTEFKATGNPETGAQYVEMAAGAGGSSDTTEATQLLVKTGIGAVTETAPSTDTASSGLNGRLQRLSAHLTNVVSYTSRLLSSTGPKTAGAAQATTALQMGGTHLTSLPTMTDTQEGGLQLDVNGRLIVAAPASENHLGEVGGNLLPISAEMTRPSDTTGYTAGDVVSNNATTTTPVQVANIFRVAGGSGYIVKLRLVTNKKSITPRLRLHFFNVNTATVSGDNLPFKEVYADSSKRLGYWDMPAMTTAVDTTNSDMSRTIDLSCRIAVTAASGSRDLFIVYETLDAIPSVDSAQKFNITVVMDNN